MKVLKYELNGPENEETLLQLPVGAKVLKAGIQKGSYFIWALVEETNRLEMRKFALISTGTTVPYHYVRAIDSIFDGKYVWHLFEVVISELKHPRGDIA